MKPFIKIQYASTMLVLMFLTFYEIAEQSEAPVFITLPIAIGAFASCVVFCSTLFMFFLNMIDITRKDKPA